MTDRIQTELCRRIDNESDRMVSFLQELVQTESVTGNEADVQRVVADKLSTLGLEVDTWEPDPDSLRDHPGYFETTSFQEHGYAGRPNVAAVASEPGDGPSLAFSGHIDTVSVSESDWYYDPWAGTVDDGRVYGRGTADMKGGVAALVHAYEALEEAGVELGGELILQTTIEEEAGGVGGLLSALERGYRPDAAIVPEPWGVPDVGIASAGVLYFRVHVSGASAHAARGYKGTNAIEKACLIQDALAELDAERKARISYEPAVRRNPAAEGNVTNLNVGVFSSGDWPSTVPSAATMECRIGWPPGESRRQVRTQIEDAISAVTRADEWLADHPPEVEWFGWSAEPHELDTADPFVQLVHETAETVTGRRGQFIGGDAGLDERYYSNYYGVPGVTMGPSGGNIHSADEYVEIESLVETAQVLASTAVDWCGATS